MKISGLEVIAFETPVDRFWNGELVAQQPVVQTVTKVSTDEGAEGYYFGGHFDGDRVGLLPDERALICQLIGPVLVGTDPFDRELIWQQLLALKVPEPVVSVIDLALWDLAGRVTGLPVHKLLGGGRDRVKAYASTWHNMGLPEGLCGPRGGVPAARLPRLQDPLTLLLGSGDQAVCARPPVACRLGHRDLPSGACRRRR